MGCPWTPYLAPVYRRYLSLLLYVFHRPSRAKYIQTGGNVYLNYCLYGCPPPTHGVKLGASCGNGGNGGERQSCGIGLHRDRAYACWTARGESEMAGWYNDDSMFGYLALDYIVHFVVLSQGLRESISH